MSPKGHCTENFDLFRSNVCHRVRTAGDLQFIAETLRSGDIQTEFDAHRYAEALYLLAMVDYLCRVHDLPICAAYDHLRGCRLSDPIYPGSVIALAAAANDDSIKNLALEESILEFRRFNIAEGDVRDVV